MRNYCFRYVMCFMISIKQTDGINFYCATKIPYYKLLVNCMRYCNSYSKCNWGIANTV